MFRIMRYLSKAEIGQMLIALVSIVGQIWLDLTLPDYMSDITTLVETPGSEMHDIWIAGGKMLLISLGSAACAIITGYFAARIGASFSQRLRSMEFRKVESFGPAEMSRFSTASLITRSTNDITQIQMFITMGLMMIVKSPIMAVWAVCKIAGDGLEWTLATGIAVVGLLVSITILMVLVMPKFKSMQRLTDNINLVARENLTGLRVVRAYNAEDYQEAKFTKANKELTDTQLFTNRAMAFMMPLMNTIMNGLMLAVYWIGAYLIDAADAADNPDRHVLTQYLGMLGAPQRLMPYFAASVPLAVGDRLLLCTDGLTGKLSDSQLQAALGADVPLPELGQALMAQALAAGPGDNITLVLIEITALDAETAVPLPQPPAEELSQTRRFEVPAARIAEQETQRKKHAHARRREIILTVAVVLSVLAAVIAALWLAVGSIPRKHPAPASTPVQTVAPTPTPASVNPPQIILPPPPTPEDEPFPEITPEPSPDTTHVPETAAPENLPG